MCRADLTGVPAGDRNGNEGFAAISGCVAAQEHDRGSMGKRFNADHLSGMSRRRFGQATVAAAAGIVLAESAGALCSGSSVKRSPGTWSIRRRVQLEQGDSFVRSQRAKRHGSTESAHVI